MKQVCCHFIDTLRCNIILQNNVGIYQVVSSSFCTAGGITSVAELLIHTVIMYLNIISSGVLKHVTNTTTQTLRYGRNKWE